MLLARAARRTLADLHIPDPPSGDLEQWCGLIGRERGRSIHIRYRSAAELGAIIGQPATSEPGPCGLLLATDSADYIAVDNGAPPFLREHTILHELAHLLHQHTGTEVDPVEEYQAEQTADVLAGIVAAARRRPWQERLARLAARKRFPLMAN